MCKIFKIFFQNTFFLLFLAHFPKSCLTGYEKGKVISGKHHLQASIPKEKPIWILEKKILTIEKWKIIKIYSKIII